MHNVHLQKPLDKMVDRLARDGILRTAALEEAFREVPRHHFLPGVPVEQVYRGTHITTKEAAGAKLSSSTAPWLMAGMLEQLRPQSGERILEVGAGTGYNAAILARVVGEAGFVSTLDVDIAVADEAREHLASFGLGEESSRAGYGPVKTLGIDGALGDGDGAPWDGILVTVRSGHIAKAWFDQLAPGGRLVVPLSLGGVRHGELSVAFVKRDGFLESTSTIDCGFIRPRGGMAVRDRELQLARRPGLYWCDGGLFETSTSEIRALLEGPRELHKAGLEATIVELIRGFQTWLVLHDAESCTVQAAGPWADWSALVPMFEIPGRRRGAGGLFDGRSIALLAFPDTAEAADASRPLSIAGYGNPADAQALVTRLKTHLHSWIEAGRPSRDRLRLRFFPAGADRSRLAEALLLPHATGWLGASWPVAMTSPA